MLLLLLLLIISENMKSAFTFDTLMMEFLSNPEYFICVIRRSRRKPDKLKLNSSEVDWLFIVVAHHHITMLQVGDSNAARESIISFFANVDNGDFR